MDRNEQFRKRLENRLSQTTHKGSAKFDPTPYVNIIMDKILWEDGDADEIEDSIEEIYSNHDLDFILGRTSLLNLSQKQLVVKELQHRLNAIYEFDPVPYANELLEIWDTKEFKKYEELNEDNEMEYDLTEFFDKHNLTKEQREMVSDWFFEQVNYEGEDENNLRAEKTHQVGSRQGTTKDLIFFISVVLIFVVIPSFFIPNYLQRAGWLAPQAGWFMKIAVGIMSAIAIFFIWRKLINFIARRIFKIEDF